MWTDGDVVQHTHDEPFTGGTTPADSPVWREGGTWHHTTLGIERTGRWDDDLVTAAVVDGRLRVLRRQEG